MTEHRAWRDRPGTEFADAILAHPSMQAVAEHEAVGRAVARLPDHWTITRIGDKYVVLVFDDRDQMSALGWEGRSRSKAATIPEAIVAALGDES